MKVIICGAGQVGFNIARYLASETADGANKQAAGSARSHLISALKLFPPKESGWSPPVHTCSALTGDGMDRVWESISTFEAEARASGYFERNRQEQSRFWLRETLDRRLLEQLHSHPEVENMLDRYEQMVVDKKISASAAADAVLDAFRTVPRPDVP